MNQEAHTRLWVVTTSLNSPDRIKHNGISKTRLVSKVSTSVKSDFYTNNKPNDPQGFKEQVKIKFEATKAIVERFPNETAALMHLLSNTETLLDWDAYCALPAEGRLAWELRANALNQSVIYLMNSKNEIAKKDLRLVYSQGNYTVYPTDIEAAARYLPTQYPNNKLGKQPKNKQRKGDDPKSEDKDNTTDGNAGAHVEDITTNEDTTTPSRGASLGAHVSESNQAISHPSRTVEEILRAHPIDDTFWDNTNPADVSVDTVNSEEQMAGSHITEFHSPEDEQIVLSDLLKQVDQNFNNQHN